MNDGMLGNPGLRNRPGLVELSAALLSVAALLSAQNLPAQSPSAETPPEMALIPAGAYRPLFRAASEPNEVSVQTFYLDKFPVTTGEFLEFVRANPRWRRSQVKPLFADQYYLKSWKGDLEPGTNAPLNAPATDLSWFAAKAYAQWKGKRLPTVAEWEYAAGAGTTRPDGENDTTFRQQVLRWYTTLGAAPGPVGANPPNFWGVHDLHGLIWEWVLDFNSAMVTGDSRADTGGLERGLFCGAGAQNARDAGNYPAFMRLGFRSSLNANYCVHNLGFRCAKDL
jgi:formylglycine-generating enzyme required for sulfatase activity